MRTKLISVAAVLFLLPLSSFGAGGYAGSFLDLGAGARPSAMGGAFTAVSDDATALFWNPAGLAGVSGKQLALSYGEMFLGRKQGCVSFSSGGLGLGLFSYGVGGISRRDEGGRQQGEFGSCENALLVAYARSLKGEGFELMVGGGGKFFYQRLAGHDAIGYGGDVGLLAKVRIPFGRFSFGAAFRNLRAKLRWDTGHEEEVPFDVRFGFALSLSVLPVNLVLDVEKRENGGRSYHLGGEYRLGEFAGLRAGLDDGRLTAGASFGVSSLRVDYGFSTDPVSEHGVHRVCAILF